MMFRNVKKDVFHGRWKLIITAGGDLATLSDFLRVSYTGKFDDLGKNKYGNCSGLCVPSYEHPYVCVWTQKRDYAVAAHEFIHAIGFIYEAVESGEYGPEYFFGEHTAYLMEEMMCYYKGLFF